MPDELGGPAPTMLGWLARHAGPGDLGTVGELAARFGGLRPAAGWPLIGEAVAEVMADRAGGRAAPYDPAHSLSVLRLLDPVRDADGRPDLDRLSDDAIAYCLPALLDRPEAHRRAVAAFVAAAHSGTGWYAAAIAARIAPFLPEVPETSGPWAAHLREILRSRHRPRTAEAELATAAGPLLVDAGPVRETLRLLAAHVAAPPGRPGTREELLAQRRGDTPPPRRLGPADTGPPRWVSTGFANPVTGAESHPDRGLRIATPYHFWFEITDRVHAASIERSTALPTLPGERPGMRLHVVLVPLFGELEITPGQDTGELTIAENGRMVVSRQPDGSAPGGIRLAFPVRTPDTTGRHRVRCNLYAGGTLLQSRLVEAWVDAEPMDRPRALTARVDYVGPALDDRAPGPAAPAGLSILVGHHDGNAQRVSLAGFGLPGQAELVTVSLPVPADQLASLVAEARKALQWVLYEPAAEADDDETFHGTFRYDVRSPGTLLADLQVLATRGSELWGGIADGAALQLSPTGLLPAAQSRREPPLWRFSRMLQPPTVIEVANLAEARQTVPAALFYDHPYDRTAAKSICATFQTALDQGTDLAGIPCFLGACPDYQRRDVICPSGFWGFRHYLGVPQSAANTLDETGADLSGGATTIRYRGRPDVVIGLATELGLDHPEQIRRLGAGLPVQQSRRDLLDAFEDPDVEPHLIYLYCHGGVQGFRPTLRVGPRTEVNKIIGDDIRQVAYWPDSRPLVFLNGCRTSAVEPQHASAFVDVFVRAAQASGLIGTETITYERLAADFAEAMLPRFLSGRQTLAEAVRSARLMLLAQGNPLGLIYTPYAPPNLRMESAPA
ncbi:hypothetical protein AB0C12_33125 [Actinoplanes sp. NPDC048967]|uniref:hypothetical protein n=1 Tax=Actinoplanes sp. NPDC048967 TaxID=3155269 RepID=UPI0034055AC9